MQLFILREDATFCATKDGAETSAKGKLHTYGHLEKLCDGLATCSWNAEWVSCNLAEYKPVIINVMNYLVTSLASYWVAENMRVALEAELQLLLLAIYKAEVTDRVLGDIFFIIYGRLIIFAYAILQDFAVNEHKLLRKEW